MTSPVYRRALVGLSALALGAGAALVGVAPATAAPTTYTVMNTLGSVTDVDSLPWAIAQANATTDVDTIEFVAGLGPTITIVDLMTIEESLIIKGPGEGALTIDAPGTVFTVNTALDPVIDVTISGLTLMDSTAVGDCGIESIDANLTIFDITASGFGCSGIQVYFGSLVATDVTANDNGSAGISFAGSDALHTLTLTNIDAHDNALAGVYAAITDSTASITGVRTTGGFFGFQLGGDNSTASISGVDARGAQLIGIALEAGTGSDFTISDSAAGAAPGDPTALGAGVGFQANDGSSIRATRISASHNESGGIGIDVANGGEVHLSASVSEENVPSAGCGCSVAGGIFINTGSNGDGIVTITGTHVLRNESDLGAGIYVGAVMGTDARLSISDSVISGNIADVDGGGIYFLNIGTAFASGPVSVVRTTISDNEAGGDGGGVSIDGFSDALTQPQFLFDSSTISGNTAGNGGGGIHAYKWDQSGRLGIVKLLNTTVSGNEAPTGAGLLMEPLSGLGAGEFGLVVAHSTVANNTGGDGLLVTDTDLDLQITHSIFSGNGATDVDWNGITSAAVDYSLIQNPSGTAVFPAAPGNIVGVDPDLGPLQNNGGPTFTHLIAPGSAAYNAGNPAITGAPPYDQRGLARIYQTIDLGAVEWHPALAATGSEPEPEPGLVGLLLLFTGLALVAASRRFAV